MKNSLKSLLPLVALVLAVCLSFWLSPAPQGQPDVEYWGHYQRVGPGLGFIVNHDSYGYLQVAHEPSRLLRPREVRQSRPLYALLGAAAGYPFAAALRLAGRLGLVPAGVLAQAHYYGIYVGYVLLNGLALLASLLLFKYLFNKLTAGRGESWQFYALAWVLVANPITKAFFWTAHQQMFAFLVPLCCLVLAVWLARRPVLGWGALSTLALGLGLLPLVYGSFVLAWPALAFGLQGPRRPQVAPRWSVTLGKLALSVGFFALPTLLWIGLLRTQGTTYYNHEAERFHQFVWLAEAWHLPFTSFRVLVGSKLAEYVGSFQLMAGWLGLAAALYVATRWLRRPGYPAPLVPGPVGPALAWVSGWFVLFFALMGYYPERLTFTLLPLVLCLVAALLPYWPRHYARPVTLGLAAGWHLYVLLSYGPFS